jgi:hypothetical protein
MDFNDAKARELAKIDQLEREYYAAWHRSCEDAETTKQKKRGKVEKRKDDDGQFVAEQPAEMTRILKGQAGDPRYLQGVERCIEKRCKIMGIESPTRHQVSKIDISTLTTAQLERLAKGEDIVAILADKGAGGA